MDGIGHKELVLQGQAANEKFYWYVLKRQRGNIRRKRPDKWRNNSWLLRHNNAPARLVQQFLAYTKTTVIPQPP
jgi:hypothetical protein